jgi:hypothetical protein
VFTSIAYKDKQDRIYYLKLKELELKNEQLKELKEQKLVSKL